MAGITVPTLAEPPGYVNRRSGKVPKSDSRNEPRRGANDPVMTERDIILEFSKNLDGLKKKVDEWGTMSFSPLILAPAHVKIGNTEDSPFKLAEGSALTLEALFEQYNRSNGTIRSAVRTETTTRAAAATNSNPMVGEVQAAQLQDFRQNRQRAEAGRTANIKLTGDQLTAARTRVTDTTSAAQAATAQQEEIAQALETAQIALKAAKRKVVAADDGDPKTRTDAERTAALEEVDAQHDVDIATKRLEAATKVKDKADADKKAALDALKAAEDANQNASAAPITTVDPFAHDKDTAAIDANSISNPTDKMMVLPEDKDGVQSVAAPAFDLSKGEDHLPQILSSDPLKENTPNTGSFPVLARINSAASALTVKNIHTFLGDPEAALPFQDKRILFAVSTLSINPGWRTKKDFKGVVTAKISLEPPEIAHAEVIREVIRCEDYPITLRRRIARENPGVVTAQQRIFFAEHPGDEMKDGECATYFKSMDRYRDNTRESHDSLLVSAVTPMVDSQNLDLASSVARQDEVALSLAASLSKVGASQGAKIFHSWVKERRKDVATKSTVATANSSTLGGGFFSFEIGPRLRGLDEAEEKGDSSAQIMDRQTFPVLLMLGMKDEDIRPQFRLNAADDSVPPPMVNGVPGEKPKTRIVITEREIRILYSTVWSRVSKPKWWSWSSKAERLPTDNYRDVLDLYGAADLMMERRSVSEACMNYVAAYEKSSAKGGMLPPGLQELPNRKSQGVNNAQDSVVLNFRAMTRQLFGTEFRHTLPANWVFNNLSGNGDRDLKDPLSTVGCSNDFKPARLSFDKVGDIRTLLMEVERAALLDTTKFAVQSEDVELVGTPVLVGLNTVAMKIRAIRDGSGNMTVRAGYKDRVEEFVSKQLPYWISGVAIEAVSVTDLLDAEVKEVETTNADGTKTKTKWWTGKLVLDLQGRGLDRLNLEGLQVPGIGLAESSPAEFPKLKDDSPNPIAKSARLILNLRTPHQTGSGLLVFKFRDPASGGGTEGEAEAKGKNEVISPSFEFNFTTPTFITGWGKKMVIYGNPESIPGKPANGTTPAVKETWKSDFDVTIHGSGLTRLLLEEAAVRNLNGDYITTTDKPAKVLYASDEMVQIRFHIEGFTSKDEERVGNVELRYPKSGPMQGSKLFTEPVTFSFPVSTFVQGWGKKMIIPGAAESVPGKAAADGKPEVKESWKSEFDVTIRGSGLTRLLLDQARVRNLNGGYMMPEATTGTVLYASDSIVQLRFPIGGFTSKDEERVGFVELQYPMSSPMQGSKLFTEPATFKLVP